MALQHPNRNQSPQERAQRAIINPNEPTPCKLCGSTFFVKRSAEQVTVSQYSIRSVSVTSQDFYECAGCGDLIVSGNMANMANKGGEREAFFASMEAGKEYREKHNPTKLVKNTASIHELEDLKAEVARLNQIVEALVQMLQDDETTETPEPIEEKPEKITRKTAKG